MTKIYRLQNDITMYNKNKVDTEDCKSSIELVSNDAVLPEYMIIDNETMHDESSTKKDNTTFTLIKIFIELID